MNVLSLFKKIAYCSCIPVLFSSCNQGNKTLNVTVKDVGTLYKQCYGKDWANAKKLAITGPINENDIAFIKAIDNNGLEELDLSKADIQHLKFYFDFNKFSTIVLPNRVETISPEAFQCCTNLKEIRINKDNTKFISIDGVLYSADTTRLVVYPAKLQNKTYTIPAKVTSISNCMFAQADSIAEFKVEEGNKVLTATNGVLYSKDKKILVAYPANKKDTTFVLPAEVEHISWTAFWGAKSLKSITVDEKNTNYKSVNGVLIDQSNKLLCVPAGRETETFTLPQCVTNIGTYAFQSSPVKKLVLNDSLYKLDKWALHGSQIDAIETANNKNMTVSDGVLYIGKTAFTCAPSYKGHVKLKETISIDERAFQRSQFEEITVTPSMVIGPFFCSYNNKLKKATFEEGIETAKGLGAFFCCTGLEEVDLPSTFNLITNRMFLGCISLKSITVRAENIPEIERHAFDGVDLQNCTLYVPAKSIEKYKSNEDWCQFKNIKAIK